MTISPGRGARALWLILIAALVASPVAAQDEDREAAEGDSNCICFDDAADHMNVFAFGPRARLGVLLGEKVEIDGRPGVRLEEVPDGTPAYRAGLRKGDIVVALDDEALGDEPVEAILEAMRQHDPGDTVAVTFYRDGDERTVQVVTDEAEGYAFFGGDPDVQFRVAPQLGNRIRNRVHSGVAPRFMERGPARSFLLRRLGEHDMELVEVNPELGEYFGTDHGILVAEIDGDSPLGLRTGDVILAIDGRDVRDPAHVRSILATYRDDETITFRIVRDGRRTEVEGHVD